MSIISGKYKVVILWHLGHDGPLRYAEIHRLFKDISDRILTKQLREMEQDCVVRRTVFAEKQVKVEYALTDIGLSLIPIVDHIYDWGREHLPFYIEKRTGCAHRDGRLTFGFYESKACRVGARQARLFVSLSD